MSFNKRRELLSELEKMRNSILMSLVYSKHAEMSTDDASLIYEVLKQTIKKRKEGVEKVEILLDSLGGEAAAAYKIVTLIREYAKKFNVIVLEKAKSAATLLALGSDRIYMTRYAELGPIDPIVSHPIMTSIMIPARAVEEFIDHVLPKLFSKYGPRIADYFMKIDYNHVGFCRASIEEAKKYAELLLKRYHMKNKTQEEIERVIEKLLAYPSHDFVINFKEAKELGLNIDLLPSDQEDIIWQLYQEYKESLNDVVLIVETKDFSREVRRPKVTIW
ncbi:MAG: hypothetical protein DRJ47_09410 [Thermoprotei archaeon]|nr:MAG: hypothetical protein DRJ47_09410 [Thermoprotei archaeon]